MRARLPITAVALVLAVTGLAGCRTNVGVAATVNGSRITENTLDSYVQRSGPSAAGLAQAKSQGRTLQPKLLVLTYLVQREVFRRVLATHGGVPNGGTLQSYRGDALMLLTQSAQGATLTDAALRAVLIEQGVKPSYLSALLEANELQAALTRRPTSERPAITAQLRAVQVRISPRYGVWDAAQLSINSTGGTPSYLTLQSTSAAQPG